VSLHWFLVVSLISFTLGTISLLVLAQPAREQPARK
jgi:hypothetical protein